MKKYKFFIIPSLLLITLLISCSKDEDYVSKDELNSLRSQLIQYQNQGKDELNSLRSQLSQYQNQEHRHHFDNIYVYSTNTITFYCAGKQIGQYRYTGASNRAGSRCAVIVYVFFDSYNGSTHWAMLPFTNDGISHYYTVGDDGSIIFFLDAGEGKTWVSNQTLQYKVLVIPEDDYTSYASNNINFNDYSEVCRVFGINDVNCGTYMPLSFSWK